MQFNLSKRHVVHFSRKRYRHSHVYSLGGESLSELEFIRNLGVTFYSDLLFDKHIRAITGRAFKRFGFILHSCNYFKSINTFRLLFCALVRSLLEYAAPVWAPYQAKYRTMIECIQHRFLRRACLFLKMPMDIFDHSYDPILCELKLLSINSRRTFLDMFLYKTVNGLIDCPDLLHRINLHIPARPLRNHALFHVE